VNKTIPQKEGAQRKGKERGGGRIRLVSHSELAKRSFVLGPGPFIYPNMRSSTFFFLYPRFAELGPLGHPTSEMIAGFPDAAGRSQS